MASVTALTRTSISGTPRASADAAAAPAGTSTGRTRREPDRASTVHLATPSNCNVTVIGVGFRRAPPRGDAGRGRAAAVPAEGGAAFAAVALVGAALAGVALVGAALAGAALAGGVFVAAP